MDDFFIKQVDKWLDECYQKEKGHYTHFLTLEEQEILQQKAKYYPTLKLDFITGFNGGERAIVYLHPADNNLFNSPVVLLKLTYGNKFKDITHRHILGNLLALGIERNRVGDIAVFDGFSYVAVEKDLVSFILMEFKTLNHLPVLVTECHEEITIMDNGIDKTLFVPSLRSDVVIAQSFNLSREKVSELFAHEYVKINQVLIFKAFKDIKIGDTISVKHYGRIKILDDKDTTRSGRIVLKIKLYK